MNLAIKLLIITKKSAIKKNKIEMKEVFIMKRFKNVIRKILGENKYRLIKLIYAKRNKRIIPKMVRGELGREIRLHYE